MCDKKQIITIISLLYETLFIMINIITIHDCEFNIIYANDDAKRILRLPFIGREKVKCYDYFHDN
jgi:hypothetical protein